MHESGVQVENPPLESSDLQADFMLAESPSIEVTNNFSEFYMKKYPAAIGYAATRLGSNRELAADITQEAFTRIYKRYDDVRQPSAYLMTIVLHLVSRQRYRSQFEESYWEQEAVPDE